MRLGKLLSTQLGHYVYSDGLFIDPIWYRTAYDVDGDAQFLYRHFQETGRADGLSPHVPINNDWYLINYPSVADELVKFGLHNTFQHYLRVGVQRQYAPVPLFDETWYRQTYPDIAAAIKQGMFFSAYQHYALHGAREGRLPGPVSGRNAAAAFTRPHLQVEPRSWFERKLAVDHEYRYHVTRWFSRPLYQSEPDWNGFNAADFAEEPYLRAFPDLASTFSADMFSNARDHWCRCGWREDIEGTRPRLPGYSEVRYLAANADIADSVAAGRLPSGYFHYLMCGWKEGRRGGVQAPALSRRTIDLLEITEVVRDFADRPLISVVMPVYNTPLPLLQQAVTSVRRQLYAHWQLCIVDDASDDPVIWEALSAFAKEDSRIVIRRLPENSGISAATNAALEMVAGQWIAFLDHDDTLTTDALYEVARTILTHPDIDVIYSDEDKITEDGQPASVATRKPDWSPDLLFSNMYLGHMLVYRDTMLSRLGGLRGDYDGAQDYDLALRAAQAGARFHHLRKPLYHWRQSAGSTAAGLTAKPLALERQALALMDALTVAGHPAKVEQSFAPGNWRISTVLPEPGPGYCLVLTGTGRTRPLYGEDYHPVLNALSSVIRSLSLAQRHLIQICILTEEALSADARRELVYMLPTLPTLLVGERSAWPTIINRFVADISQTCVLLMDEGIEAQVPDIFTSLSAWLFRNEVGIVVPRLLSERGSIIASGGFMAVDGVVEPLQGEHRLAPGPLSVMQVPHNVTVPSHPCVLIRRELLNRIGGLATTLDLRDAVQDAGIRAIMAGYRIIADPGTECLYVPAAAGQPDSGLLRQRWPDFQDPYYPGQDFGAWNAEL